MKPEEVTDEMIAKARNAYAKQWRAKNKDQIKKNMRNYWAKKAMQMMENA